MSVATTAVFLFKGYEDSRRANKAHYPDPDMFGGLTGFVDYFEELAVVVESVWEKEQQAAEFSGVYDYEIAEPMGAWFEQNISCTLDEFADELRRIFKEKMDAR